MTILLTDITELQSVADDYARADITTAQQIVAINEEDIVELGIHGIGLTRATKHREACIKAMSGPKKEPKMKKADPLEDHPAFACMTEKAADRVRRFAKAAGVEAPEAWLSHVYKRAKLTGEAEREMARFAKNLELKLI